MRSADPPTHHGVPEAGGTSETSGTPETRGITGTTPIVAVVGATAAGKSDLAVELALALGGEVVNTDAMQLYRGMDVGTAKLSHHERRGVPHHLLDVLDVGQAASVAAFQREARAVVADLRARGRVPVLVGGSALYTRAVLDRIDFPGTDPELRARLTAELEEHGAALMHARLAAVDGDAAAGIEPGNGRRIVRALEVVELTGQPFAASLPRPEYAAPPAVQVGVDVDRATLDARIERRTAAMFAGGLLDEVARLLDVGLTGSPTASRAIGYREAAAHLAGELTLAEAVERTTVATRRFVRRQEAWFRKDPRVVWVDGLDEALAAATRV